MRCAAIETVNPTHCTQNSIKFRSGSLHSIFLFLVSPNPTMNIHTCFLLFHSFTTHGRYRNLLAMTAMINTTSIVIIAIVIIRFVAILSRRRIDISPRKKPTTPKERDSRRKKKEKAAHLRAIPLSVLILLSVYPSLSSNLSLVFSICVLCCARSFNVPAPIASVSLAIR